MERYNYKGKEIIGIDHSFGNIKCRHVVFRSGVRAYDTEPPMTADAIFYGGKYYVVGEEHKGFVSDKSQDEDYYILTELNKSHSSLENKLCYSYVILGTLIEC